MSNKKSDKEAVIVTVVCKYVFTSALVHQLSFDRSAKGWGLDGSVQPCIRFRVIQHKI